jgi:hypothetical protein
MNVKYKYTVTVYSRTAYDECEGNLNKITGYDYDIGCDTLTEAKSKARHAISEEARISNEASERSVYAQVCDTKGEFRWDILDLSSPLSDVPLLPADKPKAKSTGPRV